MVPNNDSNRTTLRNVCTLILGCCLLSQAAVVNGQDRTIGDERPAGKQQPADLNRQKPSSDDDDLFKQLTGETADKDAAAENPLEQLIGEMREAQQRIDKRDTGEQTRTLQQNVVSNLEKLIEQIKQQAQSSPSSSGGSPNPSDDKSNDQNSGPPEPKPADNGQTRQDQSPESSDDPRDAEDRKTGPLTSGRMEKEVWGHLPPTLRKKLLNTYADKFLPKYDDVVRRYFESLAEEGRPAPKR